VRPEAITALDLSLQSTVADQQHPYDDDLQNLDGSPEQEEEFHPSFYLPAGTCTCTPGEVPYMIVSDP
jgi:hypothetical protein